uniref:Uncharacterized protein n=3 Tax=Haematobia irritans TaxID=7368 RepID=A0A1L8E6G3_HAEIR
MTATQQLVVTKFDQVDYGGFRSLLLFQFSNFVDADQRPQFIQVNGGAEFVLTAQVEVPHTNLTEVTWMVFVEVDTVVMHATSVTATSRVLTVFADTTVTMAHMTTQLSGLLPLDIRHL